MNDYAVIKINIRAEESDIDGPNEIKLSDGVDDLQGEIEDFIKAKLPTVFPDFKVEFTVDLA